MIQETNCKSLSFFSAATPQVELSYCPGARPAVSESLPGTHCGRAGPGLPLRPGPKATALSSRVKLPLSGPGPGPTGPIHTTVTKTRMASVRALA